MRFTTWKTRCYFEAQYMRLTTWRTRCYFEAQYMRLHEEQGATLKHKCGKRDSSIALFFSFLGLFFYFGLSLFLFGQCSNNDDPHTSIDYNTRITTRILRTRYDSIWMPPAVYRDGAMNQEWHVWKIMHGGFATNTMSTTRSCNGNMTKVMHVMMMMVEVAWQYISEWLWKCHNR